MLGVAFLETLDIVGEKYGFVMVGSVLLPEVRILLPVIMDIWVDL